MSSIKSLLAIPKRPQSTVSHTSQESIVCSDAPAATPLNTLPGTPSASKIESSSKNRKKAKTVPRKKALVSKAKTDVSEKPKRRAKAKKVTDQRSTDSGVELSSKPESSSAKTEQKNAKKRSTDAKLTGKKRERALVCYDFESDGSESPKKKDKRLEVAESDSTVIDASPVKKKRKTSTKRPACKSRKSRTQPKTPAQQVHNEDGSSDSDETVIVSLSYPWFRH